MCWVVEVACVEVASLSLSLSHLVSICTVHYILGVLLVMSHVNSVCCVRVWVQDACEGVLGGEGRSFT